MTKEELMNEVKYDSNGLVTVVVQDYHAKKVRMVAYMNAEALKKTLETGDCWYFSRSRQKLWHKGEESGYFQYLKGMSIDCDGDCLLMQVEQKGGISCHTGHATCFYRDLTEDVEVTLNRGKVKTDSHFLNNLLATIKDRDLNPKEGSYTNYLIDKGMNKILKKVGEEATEVIIAAKDNSKQDTIFEIADVMYHMSVMMEQMDISWDDIEEELAKRD
ncbi:MAG: bifunctional phosphoribosyl-AMP cyclohydrolase/phosphoribosyl-ATP diphosphatase HisIE [Acholeplasmatales bacterium]|nr:bifunctional phosphoribosyl-AMP cyclohydrolase/phosphoribosyl-ATP diphosphatase HisIE [Acholeplasmatales bacterium]